MKVVPDAVPRFEKQAARWWIRGAQWKVGGVKVEEGARKGEVGGGRLDGEGKGNGEMNRNEWNRVTESGVRFETWGITE